MEKRDFVKKTHYNVKDVVHGYINLTALDVEVVDSFHFQRLKDIKQLTCETVYPSANHTRFEHSLGVMELCKQAVENIGKNSGIELPHGVDWQSLSITAGVAGLLHDIGHLPQSHLGESMYGLTDDPNFMQIVNKIVNEIEFVNERFARNTIFFQNGLKDQCAFDKMADHNSLHELISVYIVLKQYSELLVLHKIDIDLVIRSVLGITYNEKELWYKNVVIDLLNSATIDMDKLDYIMRDSYYTGISIPPIDTKRLFKNITIHSEMKTITYKSGAISVIQNIIEARNNLYLFVYNHHVSVYTEFLSNYFLRTLDKAAKKCLLRKELNFKELDQSEYSVLNVNYYCSINSVNLDYVSDSDLQHLLKKKYLSLKRKNGCHSCMHTACEIKRSRLNEIQYKIGEQMFERNYLKPVWKTIFEFNLFMNQHFSDKEILNQLIEKICSNDYKFRADFVEEMISDKCDGYKELNLSHGDLYLIPRSNKFYTLDNMKKIFIYVKENAIMSKDEEDIFSNQLLADVIPQRNYDDLYSKKHFYLYCTKRIRNNKTQFDLFINNFVRTAEKMIILHSNK